MLFGIIVFLLYWRTIFVAQNYDYQTHLNQESFANPHRQTLMDQLFFLFLCLFSESNLWCFYQVLPHVFHLLGHEKVMIRTWGLLLDFLC